jgi:hypothetical protein
VQYQGALTLAKSYSASRANKDKINNGTVIQYDNNLSQIENLHLGMRPLIKLRKAVIAADNGGGAGGAGKAKGKKKAQVNLIRNLCRVH